ncbi:ATP-binding protein [Endothiovibrio diazotrophicus]
MELKAAIKQSVRLCKNITQKWVADEAGINAGQLSAWLNRGGPLAEEKVLTMVEAVIERIEKVSDRNAPMDTDLSEALAVLKAFDPYQAKHLPSNPFEPIPPLNAAYVKRELENRIEREIERLPFDLTFIGGHRMGKSSLLLFAQEVLRKKHRIARIDGKAYDPNVPLLPWLEETITRQLDSPARANPNGWATFPEWLRKTLRVDERPATLLLDHLDHLPPEPFAQLATAFHNLINQRRDDPSLDRINLICAWDESSRTFLAKPNHASEFGRALRNLPLAGFSRENVHYLLTHVLGGDDLAATAWELFGGHPFLTHWWAALQRSPSGRTPSQALLELERDFAAQLVTPLREKAFADLLPLIRRALNGTETEGLIEFEVPFASQQTHLWLRDTGLFVPINGDLSQAMRCITHWIQRQLQLTLGRDEQ